MDDINTIQRKILDDFKYIQYNDEQVLEYIVELGSQLNPIPQELKIEKNLIKGCLSSVWCLCECNDDILKIRADSDTVIIKGLIGIISKIYNGQRVDDVAESQLFIFNKLHIDQLVGMQRNNGLQLMINYIISFVLDNAYKTVRKHIIEILKTIYDPELNINIYDMGLIYHIHIKRYDSQRYNANIIMTFTTSNCPAINTIPHQIKSNISALEYINEAEVTIVFDPPYNVNMMNKEAYTMLFG